jgi:TatA/E family protein of Tat protein translocase
MVWYGGLGGMNIGPGEVVVVVLLALILFGPAKLPEIARGLGRALREFRRASQEITEELRSGLDEPPAPSEPRDPRPGPRG